MRERRPAAGRARPAAPAGAATDDIERTIAGVWSELLGVDDVGLDDDFFELGGHSLIAVRLIARLEKLFQKKMKLGTLFEARTVRALAEIVGNRRATSSWVSLVPIQPRGDKPPFFCVHGVGGEVLSYSSLAARLPPDQPFIGVRSRGHDGVEEPLQTIEEQAALYVAEMVAYHPDGPYYLGGYSHGGRVALEMALQLQAQGRPVAFLGIIDTWPFDYHGRGVVYSARWLANLPRWLWYELRESDLKANLSRGRRAAAVIGRRLGLARGSAGPDIADVVDVSELPAHVQRLFQTNFAAFRAYKPRARYRGTLTLFRATGQPLFSVHDPDLGWGQVTDGRVVVRPIPGNHTSLLSEPRVARLAAELTAALEGASRPAPR
jgi:thioesterase domain-containing protein/acyl carrier protein